MTIKGGNKDSIYGDVDRALIIATVSDGGGSDSGVEFRGSRERMSEADGRSP
jgi:hypothetical protein